MDAGCPTGAPYAMSIAASPCLSNWHVAGHSHTSSLRDMNLCDTYVDMIERNPACSGS